TPTDTRSENLRSLSGFTHPARGMPPDYPTRVTNLTVLDLALDLRLEVARCNAEMAETTRVINRLNWAVAETAWAQGTPEEIGPEAICADIEARLIEDHPELR
ncbi:hypothetical protein, partial [Cutibacterium avidum]